MHHYMYGCEFITADSSLRNDSAHLQQYTYKCIFMTVHLRLYIYDCTFIAVYIIERTRHDYTHYIPDTDCSIHPGLLFCGRLNAL